MKAEKLLIATMVVLFCSVFSCKQKEAKINPIAPKVAEEQKAEIPPTPHEMTSTDIEAFLDGLVPSQIERSDIAGAVIAVVKDGKMIFAKGYGYSDMAKKKTVSATDTLFRPGSISKLFTWTAVMQQVERGKINLDQDVNDYLDFKIPATFPQPITMRNIMTHTSGFAETAKDLIIAEPKDLTDLRTYVVNHIPNRIFPPGTVPAYSNYATTLAGYIVERVSGKPFYDYIDANIFRPLDMRHTTFRQPLPKDLLPLMSRGYKLASSEPGPFELVQAWPAGSVSTSANDMTHFIIAHLQNGEYNGARILRADTAVTMHSRQFAAHPEMNAMALGFYEETRNGHRIIGHGGDTYFFHSDLHLVPDAGVGFFVSYNSSGKGEDSERTELWTKFLDRYFPYSPPKEKPVASADQDAKMVSGLYMVSRRAWGNVLESLGWMGETKVFPNSDGTISVSDIKDFNGQPKKFREIKPLIYRDVTGQDRLGFKRDANGNLFFAMDYPFMTFQQVGLVQSKIFNYGVLIFSLGVLLLTLILWPVAALIRRHYGRRLELTPRERRFRLAVRLVCLIDLIFVIALMILFSGLEDAGAINYHLDPKIHLVQIIGWIGVLGTILVIYNAFVTWRHASVRPSLWTRISQALIALACIVFSWFLIYWNVLNLTSNY